MMNGLLNRLMVIGAMMMASTLWADHPYQEIVARNAFKLNAPVVEAKVELPPAPVETSSIVLSGVVMIEGRKQAFLSVTKQGEKEARYLRLSEQERVDGIEVQEIDLKQERVRIKHNGQLLTLTFTAPGSKGAVSAISTLQLQKPVVSRMIPQTGGVSD